MPWTEITSVEQLHEALESAKEKPILLFKHSTRCSISSMALNSFENDWSSENERCALCFVDLLRNRDVSNAIAEETGVVHQSPQAILWNGSEVLYQASHSGISARSIEKLLK
ncbi:MAG: bacillithiol system redox-active protein YtxJ [bacterium]|nr:bacillithiol system redox-active protein YtxJ [bacterium]